MSFETKVRILFVFFALFFAAVVMRLFYWQIFAHEALSAQAESQHFYTLSLPASRGEIRFSDASTLVSNKEAFLLYANLKKLQNPKEEIADKLSEILVRNIPEASPEGQLATQKELSARLLQKLSLENAVWVNLAHFVDRSTEEKVQALNFSGLDFAPEQTRDYPEASMAAHTVGFVGSDQNGSPKGYFGLEGFYERELAGKPGEIKVEKDAFGRPIAIGSEERREKQDGHTLITTLDRSVQHFAELELQKGIADWQAKGGTAVVMDPTSGAILALASFPRYDPRTFAFFPTELYKNPAVADLYEPGSIMKPLIMAAAINEGKLTPESRCTRCDGPRQIGGYFIHTFNNDYHPNSTMTDVLINSDNTGMVFVGETLGFDKLYNYIGQYGFGQKTGVDLQDEEEGTLRKKSDYYAIDEATLTFGQGININALQMVRAFATLANGGVLITPHLVDEIQTDTAPIKMNWPGGSRILSEITTKTITEMLIAVAENSPEHFPRDRIPELKGYQIAAKSGTAQIALGGKYQEKGTVASVIGYFPASAPKYLVYVKLNEPALRPWGSDTAGPVFFSIIRDLVRYFGIPPH